MTHDKVLTIQPPHLRKPVPAKSVFQKFKIAARMKYKRVAAPENSQRLAANGFQLPVALTLAVAVKHLH